MSESLILTKIERALLSIKEALPWFCKDSLNYQCLVIDIKKYGEECREEGLKDGKRYHHISVADIDTVNNLYGEIKELKQMLSCERQGNAYLRHHINAQSAEIENLKKQTGKRKDLKHKIARLEIDVRDRDNIISHLEDANQVLRQTLETRTREKTSLELGLTEELNKVETLKANLLNTKAMLEDYRRRARESEPMTVTIGGVGHISTVELGVRYREADKALAVELGSMGYGVKHCGIAMQVIKAHLDKAYFCGKDVAELEYSSQIEFLQGKVKHKNSVIEQLQESLRNMGQRNKATQEELASVERINFRNAEHMVKTVQRLEGELKAAKSDAEWHDADKLLPFGNRRLQMQAKGVDTWGWRRYEVAV